MKKFYFKDGLQIMSAIVLTGTTAFAMTPANMPAEPSQNGPAVVQEAKPVSKPSEEPKAPKTAKNKPEKKLTWQDNPNKCDQDTHWIAKEEPFKCILKTKTSPTATGVTTKSQPVSAPSGNKESWMAAAGIPKSDWQYVDYIVGRESGWDPCAYNPGLSDCNANPTSACGLAQSLPCGKQSKYGHWTDPVANLKWQHEYVKGRYGGYAQAYSFWLANHWY